MTEGHVKQGRVFTAEEANRMLPLVSAIMADLVALSNELTDRRCRLSDLMAGRERASGDVYAAELAEEDRGLRDDTRRLRGYYEEMRQLGLEVQGDDGLVDFPSVRDGRLVYLCWKLGEPSVSYWHEVNEGYAGRQSLRTLSLGARGESQVEIGDESFR